jgi:hypothetical protein
MTSFRHRVAILAAVLAATITSAAQAQRNDSFTWKLGINAGIMAFQTRDQGTTVVPSGGAHILVMAHRGGLMLGVDEGIGTDEHATTAVLFNDVRRYSVSLMAFPVSGPVEPYFGVGTGILQVVGPRVDPLQYPDPAQRQSILDDAHDRATSGFLTFIFGVQGRWNRFTVFGQYQAATAPGDDKLLKGANQTLVGGLRIGLGSAREGVAAGGY